MHKKYRKKMKPYSRKNVFTLFISVFCLLWHSAPVLGDHVLSGTNVINANQTIERKLRDPNRIVGGKKAKNGNYLFTIALEYQYNNRWHPHCGSSLIHPEWILTAAHCVKIFRRFKGRAIYGSFNIGKRRVKTVGFAKIVVYPNYDPPVTNDVALIKLMHPIKRLPMIQLNSNSKLIEKPGNMARVTGWGVTSQFAQNSVNDLRTVLVPVISNAKCKIPYRKVSEANICAGYDKGKKDSCTGDSGGPLFIENELTQEMTQIGIVSYGQGCAQKGFYGVYARVSHFYEWISKTLKTDKAALPNFEEDDFVFCASYKSRKKCTRETDARCFWNVYGGSKSKTKCLPAVRNNV